MAETKKIYKDFTTPFGTLVWPKLSEPDFGNVKYPNPNGSYNTGIKFDLEADGVAEMLEQLDDLSAQAQTISDAYREELSAAKKKKFDEAIRVAKPYELILDDETGEETGEVQVSVKMTYSGVAKETGRKWYSKPTILDGLGEKVHSGVQVGGGTVARVMFVGIPALWEGLNQHGVQRRLIGVQIKTLVMQGERTAEDMGFGVIDGGFDANSIERAVTVEAVEDDSDPLGGDTDGGVDGNF